MNIASAIKKKAKNMASKSRAHQKLDLTSNGLTMGKSGIQVAEDSDSMADVEAEMEGTTGSPALSCDRSSKQQSTKTPTKGSPVPLRVGDSKQHKTKKSPEIDKFKPKRDGRMEKLLGKVENDGDVWVERSFLNKEGNRMYYFRSVRTNRCVMLEPPTGSGTIVYLDELDDYPFLREFATEKIGMKISEIERPDFKGKTYKERQEELAKNKNEK